MNNWEMEDTNQNLNINLHLDCGRSAIVAATRLATGSREKLSPT